MASYIKSESFRWLECRGMPTNIRFFIFFTDLCLGQFIALPNFVEKNETYLTKGFFQDQDQSLNYYRCKLNESLLF